MVSILSVLTRNRYVLLIMMSLLLVILGFAIGRFTADADKRTEEQNNAPPPASVNDNRTFFWDIYPDLVIPNTGKKIDANLSLLDSNDTVIPLAKIPSDFPLLVLRFSKFDCHVCVNQVLDKLTTLFEGKEKHICLLVDGYTARDLRLTYKDSRLNFPIYILEKEKLGLSLENKNLPFMFTFDNRDFETNKIFIPFKEHNLQTDLYLQHIVKYLGE